MVRLDPAMSRPVRLVELGSVRRYLIWFRPFAAAPGDEVTSLSISCVREKFSSTQPPFVIMVEASGEQGATA